MLLFCAVTFMTTVFGYRNWPPVWTSSSLALNPSELLLPSPAPPAPHQSDARAHSLLLLARRRFWTHGPGSYEGERLTCASAFYMESETSQAEVPPQGLRPKLHWFLADVVGPLTTGFDALASFCNAFAAFPGTLITPGEVGAAVSQESALNLGHWHLGQEL